MKKSTLFAACSAILTIFAWLSPPLSEAKTITVACVNDAAKDESDINKALRRILDSGDTLILTGVCKANLRQIPGGITIDGGGSGSCGGISGATIEAADASQNVITLTSSENVTIKGLIIKGGDNGVSLTGVAEGTIRNNNIKENPGDGIIVNWQSHARIANNCIEENGNDGIGVNNNSSARIGFLTEGVKKGSNPLLAL